MKLASPSLAALAFGALPLLTGVELHRRRRHLGADLHGRGGGAQPRLRLHRPAVLRPARLLGHRRLCDRAHRHDLRRQLLDGPGLGRAAQRRAWRWSIGYPILRTNRHAFVISTLTFALLVGADRARLGQPDARAARHPQPAAAAGVRHHLRHHGQVLLDRLGLLGGDARLPLCAVQLAHRPHPDRHQAERAAGARPGHLADALQARLLRDQRGDHRRGGRRLHLPPAASSIRCSSTSITCRPS